MAEKDTGVVEQLASMIAQQMQSTAAAQPPATAWPQPNLAGGLPAAGPIGFAAGMPGPMPQVAGVSVPVTVNLPDGRELSVRVHFGAEAAGNLQQLAAVCLQMFGPYLQARNPWQWRDRQPYYGRNYRDNHYPRR